MENLVLLFCLITAANVIQTVTGFAGTVLVMPFAVMTVGQELAVSILNVLALLMCLFIAVKERRHIAVKELRSALPLLIAGMLLAMVLEKSLSETILFRIYGLFIFGIALVNFFFPPKKKLPEAVNILLELLAGVIHGLYVSGGPLLVLSLMHKIPEKEKLRATLSVIWVFTNSLLVVNHCMAGYYTERFFRICGGMIPAMVLGIVVGNLIFKRVSKEMFLKVSYGVMALTGIYILAG